MKRRSTARAFTLIELLLVLVILAVLAAVVIPKMTGRVDDARRKSTLASISNIKNALEAYEVDNGHYPSTSEGLDALVEKPATGADNWTHKYLPEVPIDGWGMPFKYLGKDDAGGEDYLVQSAGSDKVMDTDDDIHTNDK